MELQKTLEVTAPPPKEPHQEQRSGPENVEGRISEGECKERKETNPPSSDLQKKLLRAERFGVPVQMSELEKRSSRANRFGIGSSSSSVKDTGEQEHKRKARAERFGLAVPQSTANEEAKKKDEETKKKARLDRFTPSEGTNPEDEKRKARAIRFAANTSGGASEANGKADPELKVAVAK